MKDLLIIPVIILAVGGILIRGGGIFLIASGLFLIGFVSFLIIVEDMEFICSLLNRSVIWKIYPRMV